MGNVTDVWIFERTTEESENVTILTGYFLTSVMFIFPSKVLVCRSSRVNISPCPNAENFTISSTLPLKMKFDLIFLQRRKTTKLN